MNEEMDRYGPGMQAPAIDPIMILASLLAPGARSMAMSAPRMLGNEAGAILPKYPWDMSPQEFAVEEGKGMGKGGSWMNATRDDSGRIHVYSGEHGNMVPMLRERGLVGYGEKPQYRGWVWRGLDKEKTFLDVSDLQKSGGDFYKAYLNKAKGL